MPKKIVRKNIGECDVVAKASYLGISPFKLRRIADLVRGVPVDQALAVLGNIPHKGGELLRDIVHSAVANAVHNNKMSEDGLHVGVILINEGPRHKRFQPKARGRIYQILKRTSHVVVGLTRSEGVA